MPSQWGIEQEAKKQDYNIALIDRAMGLIYDTYVVDPGKAKVRAIAIHALDALAKIVGSKSLIPHHEGREGGGS